MNKNKLFSTKLCSALALTILTACSMPSTNSSPSPSASTDNMKPVATATPSVDMPSPSASITPTVKPSMPPTLVNVTLTQDVPITLASGNPFSLPSFKLKGISDGNFNLAADAYLILMSGTTIPISDSTANIYNGILQNDIDVTIPVNSTFKVLSGSNITVDTENAFSGLSLPSGANISNNGKTISFKSETLFTLSNSLKTKLKAGIRLTTSSTD